MKKTRSMAASVSDAARQREVQREIKNFVSALNSYPDRFAHDPCLSFEQHFFTVASANQPLALGHGKRRA